MRRSLLARHALWVCAVLAVPGQVLAQLHSSDAIERNPSAATGRAGNAKLQARLLYAKDGASLLEITTGSLDSTEPPPGYLAKIQVKSYDGDGEVVWADNYNNLVGEGYRSYDYDRFVRGQPYQVQANIRGIDGNRTNVVTVAGVALARPDLAVTELSAPASAEPGEPVNVNALVAELNGDVGASAECVLSVDGVEVDRASAIWVPAGAPVNCAFTVELETEGEKTLTVALEQVNPGDWDTTNNSKSVTVVIAPARTAMTGTYYANYYRRHNDYYSYTASGWYVNDYNPGYGYTYDAQGVDWSYSYVYPAGIDEEQAGFSATAPNQLVSFPMQVQATLSADGSPARTVSQSLPLAGSYSYPDEYDYSYGSMYDSSTNTTFQVVSYDWGPYYETNYGYPDSETSVYFSTYAGRYVFLSNDYQRYWYRYWNGSTTQNVYQYSGNSTYNNGTFMNATSSVEFDVNLDDGAQTMTIDTGAVSFVTTPNTWSNSYCNDYQYAYSSNSYNSHACYAWSSVGYQTTGSASGSF